MEHHVVAKELDELLSEPVEAVRERRCRAFDRRALAYADRLVVYGAGKMGRKVVRGLGALGRPPVAVADRSAPEGGGSFEGLPLLTADEAARKYGDCACFVVAVWSPGPDRTFVHISAHLRSLGCRCVVPVVPLLWQYPDTFLPHDPITLPETLPACAERIRTAFELLADDVSRTEYVARIRLALHGDPLCLPPDSPDPIYLPRDVFAWSEDERFADCGAYDGDTLREFISRGVPFAKWWAFEPDPANYRRLVTFIGSLPTAIRERITAYQAATGAKRGRVGFAGDASEGSHVDARGSIEVECMSLDELPHGDAPTYIKLDVEGAEESTLRGASSLIRSCRPILAVSAYHRLEDLWELPLLVHDLRGDYRIMLRRHGNEYWDVVLYAVPPSRVPRDRRAGEPCML